MSFNIELTDNSEQILNKIKSLDGMSGDLFPENFMKEHSKFGSLGEMAQSAGISSPEDFENNSLWDKFVSENTDFSNWNEMLNSAKRNLLMSFLGQ